MIYDFYGISANMIRMQATKIKTCYINLHGSCEEARNLLAALIVSSTDATLVKLLAGAEFTVTACFATFALNTDS